MNMDMMEEDSKWGFTADPVEKTISEKKKQVKKILENDIELLNEIIVDIRNEKINKIRKTQ